MDIKAKMEEVVKKIKSDDKLMEKFNDNPTKVIEDLIGVDLPDDQVDKVIDGIKAKLTMDNVSDAVGAIGKLFK